MIRVLVVVSYSRLKSTAAVLVAMIAAPKASELATSPAAKAATVTVCAVPLALAPIVRLSVAARPVRRSRLIVA